MKEITYHSVPTATQFQKDSAVKFAIRKDDRILAHLDWLLERLYAPKNDDFSIRRVILADLFLTANYWIKSYHEKRPNMKKERYPAVLALFEAVVNQLCNLLGCNRPGLAAHIEEIYGRDLTEEGRGTDLRRDAHFYDKLALAEHRLRFKGGLAYHYKSAHGHNQLRLEPLNSAEFYVPVRRGEAYPFPDWGSFVMTLEREFYMSKHTFNEPDKPNIFHSSYTAGGMVAAAGTMFVKHGKVLGIRPDSGHYKPLEQNIVGAIQALGMLGVNLRPIKIYDYLGNELGNALEFMKSRLSWSAFQAAGQNLRSARAQRVPFSTTQPHAQVHARSASGHASDDSENLYNTDDLYNN